MDNKKVENKKHMSNKKKFWVGMSALAAVGVITATVAYFSSFDQFTNEYSNKSYSVQVQDVIDTDKAKTMTPGETVNTDVTVKNLGKTPIITRIKYIRSGYNSDTDEITWPEGGASAKGVELPSKADGGNYELYTLLNTDKFLYNDTDGYYYCNQILDENAALQHLDAFTYDVSLGGEGNGEPSATTQYPSEIGENNLPSAWSNDAQKYEGNSKYGTGSVTTYKRFPSGVIAVIETIQATDEKGKKLTIQSDVTAATLAGYWTALGK